MYTPFLWIDVDHVLQDLDMAVVEFCKRYPELSYHEEPDIKMWCYGYGKKRFAPIYNHMIRMGWILQMEFFPGVIEAVAEIKRGGWDVGFLTARCSIDKNIECTRLIHEHTRQVFHAHGLLDLGQLVFEPDKKSEYIAKNGGDAIIDDHPGTCFDCSRVTSLNGGLVKAYLKSCPHNEEGELSDFTPRVACLSELPDLVLS